MSTATTQAATPVTFAGCHLVGYTEHPRMSEETTAFDAEVHLDGQQIGVLSNTGRGGESTFSPTTTEGWHAFTAAEKTFEGIPDTFGGTMTLIDVLEASAASAKALGGRSISFVPNMDVNDLISSVGDLTAYRVSLRAGETAHDVALDVMKQVPEVQTLVYPAREKKGYRLYTATR